MNWLQKAAAIPARALSAMRHSGRQTFWTGLLKRTRFDYRREVGDGLDASVVTAPIQWVQRALPEARIVIQRTGADGDVEELEEHDLLTLLDTPNPFYGWIALIMATVLDFLFAGNAYWLKIRNGNGRVVEVWWAAHLTMTPKWPEDGSEYISYYEYRPAGEIMRIDPDDVVHFRHGIDPRNIRLGLSPLDGAIREIFMDLESSNFVATLLRNMAVPGVVMSPKGGAMPAPEDVEATKAWFKEAFGGDKRGGPLVMGAPTDVNQFGFNPQQLEMSSSRNVAEERVCACLGVPAAVVGFGAGLQQTKVGATMGELRKLGWHNGVLPFGRMILDEIKRSLLPDFGNTAGLNLDLDTSGVLALQEDKDKETERWNKMLHSGAITVFEWRIGLGMDADESHRFYLRPIAFIEVPEGAPARGPEGDPAKALPAPRAQPATKNAVPDDWVPAGAPDASPAAIERGERYATMLQRLQAGHHAAFERSLKPLFADLGTATGEAAREELDDGKAQKNDEMVVAQILARLGIAEWRRKLRETYETHYLSVGEAVAKIADEAGLANGVATGLPDRVARSIVAAGGSRAGLVDIEEQSRAAIFSALAEGRAEGEGADALAARIADNVEAGYWQSPEMRARVIARTETKYAQNVSTIERARAGGVERFIVFDGRFGEPRSERSHIARDGKIVSAEDARTMADSMRPNCTLSFAPHFEEDE